MSSKEQEKTLANPTYVNVNSLQNNSEEQEFVPKYQSKFCGWFGDCSKHTSCWIRKNTKKILIAMAVLVIIYLLFVLVVVEIEENNLAAESNMSNYLKNLYHWKCKNNGCGSKCPHSDKSDPRVFVSEHTEYIGSLLDACRDHLSQEISQNAFDVKKYPKIAGELHQTVINQSTAVDNLFLLYMAAKTIDNAYSNCKVNNNTYTAQNHLAALSNAADVNKCRVLMNSLCRSARVTQADLKAESELETSKIPDFDKHRAQWNKSLTDVLTLCDEHEALVSKSSEFESSQIKILESVKSGLVLGRTKESSEVLNNLLMVISTLKFDNMKNLQKLISNMQSLNSFKQAYNKAHRETFNNDMPGKLNNTIANDLIQRGDYNEAIIRTALEPDVVSKHKEFAASRANATQTLVSKLSVRDDPNDVIPWVAYSRPTYTKSDGVTSIDQSEVALKQIPSDNTNAIRAKRVRFMI